MQTHGGSAAEAAITASERHLRAEVKVDWNNNGLYDHPQSDMSALISDVTTDRSLQGSAPEELYLIEGASACEMTFIVGGLVNGVPALKHFSPYNPSSMFYAEDMVGMEVTYRIGVDTAVGTVWYSQFVGIITEFSPDRASATIEFRAIDRAELLRRPVRMPRWTAPQFARTYEITEHLTEPQWVIDHCLKSCDVSATPYRPASDAEVSSTLTSNEGVLGWISCTGSEAPNVGSLYIAASGTAAPSFEGRAPFVQFGPSHPAVPAGSARPVSMNTLQASSFDAEAINAGLLRADRTHYLGFTLSVGDPGWDARTSLAANLVLATVQVARALSMSVMVNSNQLWIRTTRVGGSTFDSSTVSIPLTPGPCRVLAIWDNSTATGSRVYLRVGSNSMGGFQVLSAPQTADPAYEFQGALRAFHEAYTTDVMYGALNISGPSTADPFTKPAKYGAEVQRSINLISTLVDATGTDAWDIIKDVAAAEMGSVFWDEDGVFHFWTLDHMISLQSTVVKTLTLNTVSSLGAAFNLSSVRNVWTVTGEGTRFTRGPSFEAKDANQFIVPPSTTTIFRLSAKGMGGLTDTFQRRGVGDTIGLSDWDTPVLEHFSRYVLQFSTTGTGSWAENHTLPNITMDAFYDKNDDLQLLVKNNSATHHVRLAHDSGTDGVPALILRGDMQVGSGPVTDVVRDTSSIAKYGVRNAEIRSPWVQDPHTRSGLSTRLLARTARPVPISDTISTVGDPRLQLGDTLQIQDQEGFGSAMTVQIYGIRRSFSVDGGLSDELTVELVRPNLPGFWDDPIRGRWDETLVWSA